MFGFDRFNAACLVIGDDVTLIDTGTPTSWAALLEGMAAHGFGPATTTTFFVTHAEHPDHIGNEGRS
jgi:glyoxylase-like metal-dependent hydrolase (beta-lactamase superfamily II)